MKSEASTEKKERKKEMVFGLWKEWLTADLVSLGIRLGIASIGTAGNQE